MFGSLLIFNLSLTIILSNQNFAKLCCESSGGAISDIHEVLFLYSTTNMSFLNHVTYYRYPASFDGNSR